MLGETIERSVFCLLQVENVSLGTYLELAIFVLPFRYFFQHCNLGVVRRGREKHVQHLYRVFVLKAFYQSLVTRERG